MRFHTRHPQQVHTRVCSSFSLQCCTRACLKNHSCHLHSPLCVIFAPNSGYIARYAPFIWRKSPTNCEIHLTESIFQTRSRANKPYRARLAALAKNSRERGWVHSGGGFGRMFRIAWYSAKQLGAATGHSQGVAAGYLAILNILERTPPECTYPLSWRPFL